MTRRTASFALLVLFAAPSLAADEWSGIRPEFDVSTGPKYSYYSYVTPHNEGHNSVDIAGSNDTFVVVWEDLYTYAGGYYGRSNPGIWARRLDGLGRPLGPEFRVSSRSSYARGDAHVSTNAQGQFVVVWDDYYAEYDVETGGEFGIMAARLNSGGGALGSPFVVNTDSLDSYGATPKVALADSGRFMIVWVDSYTSRIEGRLFDSNGDPLGGEFQVNSEPLGYCCYSGFENAATFDEMNIAAGTNGNFMVVWSGGSLDDPDYRVRARVFDASATPLGPEFVVNPGTSAFYNFQPNVAADGSGRFVVAWTEKFGYDVRVRRFDTSGTPLGSDFVVNEVEIYNFSYGPGVAADAAGNFVVTWDDQEFYEIFGRRIDATGTPIGGQFRVDEPSPYDYDEPGISIQKVGATRAGDFVVAWAQYDLFEDYVYGVVGRKIGVAPTPCSPAPLAGCRTSITASGLFTFKQKANPKSDSFTWKLDRGPTTLGSDFGDPLATDSYSFCVYDASANPQPLLEASVPPGGACGKLPCWKPFPGGRIDYFDRPRYVAGLELIRMLPGPAGKAKVQVTGRGERLALPNLPLSAPITVQLQVANGECWSAVYSGRIKRNASGIFKALPDP